MKAARPPQNFARLVQQQERRLPTFSRIRRPKPILCGRNLQNYMELSPYSILCLDDTCPTLINVKVIYFYQKVIIQTKLPEAPARQSELTFRGFGNENRVTRVLVQTYGGETRQKTWLSKVNVMLPGNYALVDHR